MWKESGLITLNPLSPVPLTREGVFTVTARNHRAHLLTLVLCMLAQGLVCPRLFTNLRLLMGGQLSFLPAPFVISLLKSHLPDYVSSPKMMLKRLRERREQEEAKQKAASILASGDEESIDIGDL